MRLLDDKILVEPLAAEEKVGSIVLPEVSKEKNRKARVVAVGPGKFYPEAIGLHLDAYGDEEVSTDEFFANGGGRRPVAVEPGDVVLIGKYCGDDYKHEGRECRIIFEHDVVAVLEESAT
jgi:chaperonin GroES